MQASIPFGLDRIPGSFSGTGLCGPRALRGVLGAALLVALWTGTPVGAAAESYRNLDDRECPILDTPYRTWSEYDIGYTLPASTDAIGWGDKLSVIDINVWLRFLNWENAFGGELDMQVRWDNMLLEGFANASGVDAIHALSMARLFLQWSQRFVGGYGLQVHAEPGLYMSADGLDGDIFSLPAGLKLIKALSPNSAFFLGVNYYPDFKTQIDPVCGFIHAQRDDVVLRLAYPESNLDVAITRNFRFRFGARMLLWPDYALDRGDARERLRYREGRAFGGLEWGCTRDVQIALRAGYAFARKISFADAADDVAIDDAPFLMIGIGGRL